ncbi:MAG: thioredoxin [Clostridia bacterium]|nr:thioredoxin [Clostridia bacterium]
MNEVKVTAQNFEAEVLNSPVPVIVDFWATWCGPCRMLSPIIAQIAEEKAGALKVGKINVDEEPTLAARFGVSSIPLVVKFVSGKPVASAVGYMPKKDLERMLGI